MKHAFGRRSRLSAWILQRTAVAICSFADFITQHYYSIAYRTNVVAVLKALFQNQVSHEGMHSL